MESLKGHVCLITGASSGIGEGIAIHLAGLGCRLALTGRSESNLERVAALCVQAGVKENDVLTFAGDIKSADNRKTLVEKTVDKFEGINVLVNNAGVCTVIDSIANVTPEDYDEIFDTNIKSHVFLTQLAIPFIIKAKGSIINNSSIAGQRTFPQFGVYCMSKASMDMFTQCLALELAPHGVRVNSINPGIVATNFLRSTIGPKDSDAYTKVMDAEATVHPLGRIGLPVDCARAVAFLASKAASFTTGQIFFIDGGRHCVTAVNVGMQ